MLGTQRASALCERSSEQRVGLLVPPLVAIHTPHDVHHGSLYSGLIGEIGFDPGGTAVQKGLCGEGFPCASRGSDVANRSTRNAETATALALGPDGAVYVTGTTTSTDFPTSGGAFQPAHGSALDALQLDAFVACLQPAGAATDCGVTNAAPQHCPQAICRRVSVTPQWQILDPVGSLLDTGRAMQNTPCSRVCWRLYV